MFFIFRSELLLLLLLFLSAGGACQTGTELLTFKLNDYERKLFCSFEKHWPSAVSHYFDIICHYNCFNLILRFSSDRIVKLSSLHSRFGSRIVALVSLSHFCVSCSALSECLHCFCVWHPSLTSRLFKRRHAWSKTSSERLLQTSHNGSVC